jgi:hypothetical protein
MPHSKLCERLGTLLAYMMPQLRGRDASALLSTPIWRLDVDAD